VLIVSRPGMIRESTSMRFGGDMANIPLLTFRQKVASTFGRRFHDSGFWYGLAIFILWPFTLFGTRLGWRGGENIPGEGGVLLAINHVSSMDPIYDVAFVTAHGRMPRFLAKGELWSVPVAKWVLGGGKHIPVYRATSRAANAYTDAIEALKRGEVVAFYPEGTHTGDPTFWPMKAKNGIGRIALSTGVPVIPVANWGSQDVLPPDGRLHPFPRKKVTVLAGPPVDLSQWLGGPRTRTALDGATAAIMADITKLVGELRGETPPAEIYDPDAVAPKAV
jgi:1-acyl-sn-glycerol-3-phosphate acyltransferase